MRNLKSEFHHSMGTYLLKPFFNSLDGWLDNGFMSWMFCGKNGFASE